MNREKSRTVSVFAIRNFKYLGFCFGKNGKGIYVRVHGKSWKKAKDKLRKLTSRSRCGSIVKTHGTDKRIHAWMAELLQYSRHEEQHRKAERMAVSKDTNVYLETVETAKDAKTEADRTGNARMGSTVKEPTAEKPIGEWQGSGVKQSTNKRKTDKLGLL